MRNDVEVRGTSAPEDAPDTAQCRRQVLEQFTGCMQEERPEKSGGLATKMTAPVVSGALDYE